jgi:hypothetical protein
MSRQLKEGPSATNDVVRDMQSNLLGCHPRMSQLADLRAESTVLKSGEDGMGQGRAAQVLRQMNTQPARPTS